MENQKDYRILIVEDNRVNQLLVQNMLRNFGFSKFDAAENGKVALEKLRINKYDLILMDIQMPEMNGYEITVEIRSNLPDDVRRIPIIALSANGSQKEKEYAHEAGMDDFIVKPYTPEELYGAITYQMTGKAITDNSSLFNEVEVLSLSPGITSASLEKYTGGDLELEAQLIEIFLRQIPEAIQKLETHIPQADWKHIYNIAHKIKGSIAIFGFSELKKILIMMEDFSIKEENLEEITFLLNQFKKLSKTAVAELEAQLKKLKKEVGG